MRKNAQLISGSKSTLASLTLQLLTVSGQVLLIPFYLRCFGIEIFAEWTVATSLSAFILIADFGLITVVTVYLTGFLKEYGTLDWLLWKKMLKVSRYFFIFIFLTILLYFLFLQNSRANTWLGTRQASLVFLILLLATGLSLPQHIFLTKFQLKGRLTRGLFILAAFKSLEVALILYLLVMRTNPLTLALSIITVRLASTYTVYFQSSKFFPRAHPAFVPDTKLGSLVRPTIGVGLYFLASILSIQGVIQISRLKLDSTGLVLVLLSRMIASPMRIVSDAMAAGVSPIFIKLGLTDQDRATRSFSMFRRTYNIIFLCITLLVLILLATLGGFFWAYLSARHGVYPAKLVSMFLISTFLDAVVTLQGQFYFSTNRAIRIAVPYLASVILALSLQWVLIERIGTLGVPTSLIIGDVICIAYMLGLQIREKRR